MSKSRVEVEVEVNFFVAIATESFYRKLNRTYGLFEQNRRLCRGLDLLSTAYCCRLETVVFSR